jgi:hypothetical protein
MVNPDGLPHRPRSGLVNIANAGIGHRRDDFGDPHVARRRQASQRSPSAQRRLAAPRRVVARVNVDVNHRRRRRVNVDRHPGESGRSRCLPRDLKGGLHAESTSSSTVVTIIDVAGLGRKQSALPAGKAGRDGHRLCQSWRMPTTSSPIIAHIEWGKVEVDGFGVFKDAKLWPGGARAWDWRETGTGHVPGIQVADVEELLAAGAMTVVLSRGMDLVLQVSHATVAALDTRGISVHVLETREAVRLYNELAATVPVGALVHSTC